MLNCDAKLLPHDRDSQVKIPSPPPIHIMHVVTSFDKGGLENGVVNLINRLDCERFRHSLCCIQRSGNFIGHVQRRDVKVFELNKTPGLDWHLPGKLFQLFQANPVDVVHTRNWGTIDAILPAKMAGVPIVIHGEHGRDMTDPDGRRIIRRWTRRLIGWFVDQFVAVSQDLSSWLVKSVGIPEGKVVAIPNGVDVKRFSFRKRGAERHQQDAVITIGTVGRFDPVKDQELLIRAFADLVHGGQSVHLLLVGYGPCQHNLEALVEKLQLNTHVHFAGQQSDIPTWLSRMDVFVLPSLREGLSNTILEAMASGLPVIATRVGGNPELVIDGVTGFLIPTGDVNALRKALAIYVGDPALLSKHGLAGRDVVETEFNLDRMVSDYDQLYTKLLATKTKVKRVSL